MKTITTRYFELECDEGHVPVRQTTHSACADVFAVGRVDLPFMTKPQRIPIGVRIKKVLWENVPDGQVPELQLRSRSGHAKNMIILANGVGTVDADFPLNEDIFVLLINIGDTQPVRVQKGERCGQITEGLRPTDGWEVVEREREGGAGSTGTGV